MHIETCVLYYLIILEGKFKTANPMSSSCLSFLSKWDHKFTLLDMELCLFKTLCLILCSILRTI